MSVDTISSTTTSTIRTLTTESRTVDNELGKDAFLQILVAQMANQDPLSPTSDTEFVAQMAQFSALEQMQNMNSAMQTQMAYSYLGKEITSDYAVDGDGNLYQQGIYGQVVSVVNLSGTDYLQVQDYTTGGLFLVPPDQVTSTMASSTIEQYLANLTVLMGQVVTNTTVDTQQTGEETTTDTIANA